MFGRSGCRRPGVILAVVTVAVVSGCASRRQRGNADGKQSADVSQAPDSPPPDPPGNGSGAPCRATVTASTAAPGGTPPVEVSAGGAHACLRLGTELRCWGRNRYGELGHPPGPAATPKLVENLPPVVAVSAGGGGGVSETGHTCAVTADGRVFCWGRNDVGQLGDGTTDSRATPTQVKALTDVRAIAAGSQHTCALRSDGKVLCWGRGDSGQLGTGNLDGQLTPVEVKTTARARSISVGHYHGCLRDLEDHLWCWGANSRGEVGSGDRVAVLAPATLAGITGSFLATGFATTCLVEGPRLLCWGANDFGQANASAPSTEPILRPARVAGLDSLKMVALGGAHACAVRDGGGVACWGSNAVGQLGRSEPAGPAPAAVGGLPPVVQLDAGGGSTFAVSEHQLFAWGDNSDGQLGDGTTKRPAAPLCLLRFEPLRP